MGKPMKKTTQGMTLIELMVVVAVIGIIAAVAYPSYQSHVRKSRRAEAVTMLQAAQLAQEKYRLRKDSYANTADFDKDSDAKEAFAGVCKDNKPAPCMSPNGYYKLEASGASASAYTLRATPLGAQENDSGCKPIEVALSASQLTLTPPGCWSK